MAEAEGLADEGQRLDARAVAVVDGRGPGVGARIGERAGAGPGAALVDRRAGNAGDRLGVDVVDGHVDRVAVRAGVVVGDADSHRVGVVGVVIGVDVAEAEGLADEGQRLDARAVAVVDGRGPGVGARIGERAGAGPGAALVDRRAGDPGIASRD